MVFLVEDFVNLPSDQIANIWLAAHTQKLAKKDIKKTKLGEACDQLHSDKTKKPMQLRHYAQCLMGIAWIHCEQVKILHSDCTEAFSKARLILVRKRKVDLDPAQERGRDITLPEHRHNHNLNLPANEQPDLLQDIDLNDTNYSQLLLRGDDENISDTASLLESHSGRGEHLALDHEITMQQNNYTSPSRTRAGRVAVTDRRSSFGGISSLLESGEYDLEIKFDDDEDEEPLDESKAQRSQNTDNVAFDEDETDDENRSVERGRGAATTTNHNTALFNTTHDHISDIGSVNAQAVAIDLDDTHSRVSLEKEKRLDDLGSVHSAGSLQDNVPMIDAQAMEIDDHSIDDQQPLHVEFNLDAQSVTGSVSTAILDGKEAEDERATPPPSPGAREKRARSQRGRVDEDESEQVQQDADGEAQRKKKKKKKDKKKRKKKFSVDKTIEFKSDELREADPERFDFVYQGGRDAMHIWREFPLSSMPFDELLYQPLAKEHFGKFPRDVYQKFHDCNKLRNAKAKDLDSNQHEVGQPSDELADINILRDSADEIEQGRDDANLVDDAGMMNDLPLPMNDVPLQPDDVLMNGEQPLPMIDEAGAARYDDDAASTLDSLVDDNIPPPEDPVFDQDAVLRAPEVDAAGHDKEEDEDEDIDLNEKENVDDSNRLSFEEGDHEEMTQMEAPNENESGSGKDGEVNNLKLRDWSRRTKKTFIYLKRKPEKELSFNELVKSGTTKRETVVGVFYELLVFKNSDLVDLQQDEPYGDITITKTDNFYRHARVSQLWARRLSQQ